MRVGVLCEYSGIVRDAFIRHGHDAISCDLLPTEAAGPHIEGDCLAVDWSDFDLLVCHPPCTYLCNSGVRWLGEREGRVAQMQAGAAFFRAMLALPCPRIAVENPIMHKHASSIVGQRHTQLVQPWQFGHPETKAVCLWLKGLPPLIESCRRTRRDANVHRASPGPNRSKERSRFYAGIADAMAAQWGSIIAACDSKGTVKA